MLFERDWKPKSYWNWMGSLGIYNIIQKLSIITVSILPLNVSRVLFPPTGLRDQVVATIPRTNSKTWRVIPVCYGQMRSFFESQFAACECVWNVGLIGLWQLSIPDGFHGITIPPGVCFADQSTECGPVLMHVLLWFQNLSENDPNRGFG